MEFCASELGGGMMWAGTEVELGAEGVGMLKKAEICGMVFGWDQ